MTTKNRTLAFFCDPDPSGNASSHHRVAVLVRCRDWIAKSDVNDEFKNVLIIDSKETKFSILDTEENIRKEEGENYDDFIRRISDKLEDCLTVVLDTNKNN